MILHILLWILKIIGIALAVILCMCLLLIGILLFVPVRYEIFFRSRGMQDSLEADIHVSWFLRLVAARIRVNGIETDFCVRAAWKQLFPVKEKEESEETENFLKEKQDNILESSDRKEEQKAEQSFQKEEILKEKDFTQKIEEKEKEKQKTEEKKKTAPDKEADGAWFRKILDFWNKIKAIWVKIKYTITGICDKIEVFIERKDRLTEFLAQEEHRKAFSVGVSELRRVLIILKPKELHGKLRFGFSDPYLTGNTLALLGIIYPFLGDSLEIIPEFEECVLEGEVFAKGKLRVGTFVRTAIRLLRSRELRMTVRDIKKFRW
ncbi:MAG: DUF2953 domain-containing protein [Lachnospiraceae bacterium]|nr:DUF2953 domain-containing protein [Lachnospiraceae bacterium]